MANPELLPNLELKDIRKKELILRGRFIKEAKVIDVEKGFIKVLFVNQKIDPIFLGYAADIIFYHINQNKIKVDEVVGIPNSGTPLAVCVALKIKGSTLDSGRKGETIPSSWDHPIVIKESVESYTTGEKSSFVFSEIEETKTIAICDDAMANGDTAIRAIEEFKKRGIKIAGVFLYFAKLFQPGVERIEEETGIKPFYVIGVKEITPEEKINLSPPQF